MGKRGKCKGREKGGGKRGEDVVRDLQGQWSQEVTWRGNRGTLMELWDLG